VVEKKQGTAKISPLIVSPDYRGDRGIGSRLLAHAEEFALDRLGARQLYCTVAAPNRKALNFFRKKGFYITGKAKSHYKLGINEYMLYKQLDDDAGYEAPNISVIPFDRNRHGEDVRKLILTKMSDVFLGVDDNWVDALFNGYERRNSADVNEKFKIIYVAESDGEVVGVAGATPKKGEPIKLMPVVAANEAAFEALVIDLQTLLLDFGHKLYLHLVPEAWQIACLQRHGWSLEGVFPGGYAPNSIVQQWGLNMKKEGKVVRMMRIKRPYYDAIMQGRKPLEVRVGYDSIRRHREGDLIELHTSHRSSVVRVKSIRVYQTFEEMLQVEPWDKIAPDAMSEAETLKLLHQIYPPHKESLGVYVFQIEPARPR
jgi:ASC-1-like (ASCH) protein/N-acetylglutamate synthase-like GNAT family acetyltransferase